MKQLNKSPFINSLLALAVGEGVDTSGLHVYEVRATSTVALRGKSGTVFDRAKISPNTIAQLAQAVTKEPVPLMMDHNLSGSPYGKFFYAESIPMDNGETELRGLLYVDQSEEKIRTKLDAGSIDEVSIQFLSERILCSECGFDYMEAAANGEYMPFLELACDEGHKIGENGVHTNIVGVADTVELSLVSRGAAKNSKIIAPSDAKLGSEAQRLAAAGVELNNFYCTASINDVGEEEVNVESFMTQLNTVSAAKEEAVVTAAKAEAKVETLEASVTQHEETITGLETQVTELETQLEAATPTEEQEKTATALAALSDYIGKQFVALKALDGEADVDPSDNLEEMVEFITENETRLSALIPTNGASTPAGAGTSEEAQAKAERAKEVSMKADSFRSN